LVVVVASASDDYYYIPTLWAATVALLVPGAYFLWEWITAGGWQLNDSTHGLQATLYIAQVTVFLGALLLMPVGANETRIPTRARTISATTIAPYDRALRHFGIYLTA